MRARLFRSTMTFAVLLGSLVTASAFAAPSVAITQIVEHPSLDACRQGIRDELAAQGFTVGETLEWTYESAQGNPTTAAQVARKFAGMTPDVIVAITTPSAQTAAAAARGTPLVFAAVTDPVGAKLVKHPGRPGGLITGVSDLTPIDRHMALVKRITPDARRLGVIFNPGEANSATLVALVKRHAPEHGMEVVEAGATKTADVLGAARSLVGKVDAIYLPTDNTVISALEAVLKVGMDAGIPVITGDTDSVKRGAVAALGFDYYDVGRQTGQVVARVLRGEKPGDIPVEYVKKLQLFVNPGAAAKMGVTLPAAMIEEAKEVIR